MKISARTRNRSLLILFVAVVGVAVNWIYPFDVVMRVDTPVIYSDFGDVVYSDFGNASITNPHKLTKAQESTGIPGVFRLGGWPMRFYYSRVAQNGTVLSALSVWRLLLNVLFWGALLAFVVAYELCIHRTSDGQAARARSLSLSDLFLVIASICLILVYGRQVSATAWRHNELASAIVHAGGSVERVAYAPTFFKGRLPTPVQQALMRVTRAELIEPDTEAIRDVLSMGTVEELLLSGGSYDLRVLDDLKSQTSLQALRVAGREVDAELLAAIGATKQLEDLSLIFTNVTAAGMNAMGEMPLLYRVMLSSSDVFLENGSQPVWAKEVFSLSLPGSAEGRSHRLHGWPKLRGLNVEDLDSVWTDKEFGLSLRDLTDLRTLGLDAAYLFNLYAEGLPRLAVVNREGTGSRGVPQGQREAKNCRLATIEMRDVPRLEKLAVDLEWLRDVHFEGTPNLEFHVSLEPVQLRPHPFKSYGSEFPKSERQAWVNLFDKESGLTEARLSQLNLTGVDLTPLAKNTALKSIELADTQVTVRQVATLHENKSIEQLDLSGCTIDGSELEKLLTLMPRLRLCRVDEYNLQRLRVKDNDGIEGLIGRRRSGFWSLDALHLENVVKLKDPVGVGPFCEFVKLVNVPSLRAFVSHAPLPKHAEIQGVRDLEYFAAGGKELSDRIAREVIACKPMKKLCLAFADISDSVLKDIGQLSMLEVLVLTGTEVGDQTLESLKELKRLRKVRLDRTGVNAGDLAEWIQGLQGITELGVENVTAEFAETLGRLEQLLKLWIVDSTIDDELMSQICAVPDLQFLSLDGCKLTTDAAKVLAQQAPPTLLEVSLKDAEVPGKALLRLATLRPRLSWYVRGLTTDLEALDFIMANSEILDADESGMNVSFYYSGQPIVTDIKQQPEFGEVDPVKFEDGQNSTFPLQPKFPGGRLF